MWNPCKGLRTGPSLPSCSHLSGRDLQIPPLEFGSFTMGPPAQGLADGLMETPFLRFPPAPKSSRDRWGEGGDAQRHLPLSLLASSRRQSTRAPPAKAGRPVRLRRPGRRAAGAGCRRPGDLVPQIQVQARRADEIRSPGLAQRHYLARTVAPGRAARGAAGPRKSYFSMGPRGPLSRGAGTAAEQRACAATRPDFRTAGEALRVAESPQLPASARRAHTGRTPPHSHALHTHGVSGPTPVPRNHGLPAPARAPPSSPDLSTLLQRPRITSQRGPGGH